MDNNWAIMVQPTANWSAINIAIIKRLNMIAPMDPGQLCSALENIKNMRRGLDDFFPDLIGLTQPVMKGQVGSRDAVNNFCEMYPSGMENCVDKTAWLTHALE